MALTFLSLPPEIRQVIYRYAFTGARRDYDYDYGNGNLRTSGGSNLLLVCREITPESTEIYYRTTTFHFHGYTITGSIFDTLSPKMQRNLLVLRIEPYLGPELCEMLAEGKLPSLKRVEYDEHLQLVPEVWSRSIDNEVVLPHLFSLINKTRKAEVGSTSTTATAAALRACAIKPGLSFYGRFKIRHLRPSTRVSTPN